MNGEIGGGIDEGAVGICKADGAEGVRGRFLREFSMLFCNIVRGSGVLGKGSDGVLEDGGHSWWSRLGWREGMLRIGVVGDGGS